MISSLWPFKRQASETERVLALVREVHQHIADLTVGPDFVEAEARLTHAVRVLRAHDGEEA